MFNLLPPKEQKAVGKEYALRRLVILFLIIFDLAFISLVLLFSSYTLSNIRLSNTSFELLSVKQAVNKAYPTDDLLSRLAGARDKVRALEISPKNIFAYDLLRIFEGKPSTIRLREISYRRSPEATSAESIVGIEIKGTALNRESLIAFEKQLKAREEFSKVDLPISNFAKDKDIDFSINIVVKN